ncbi:MAG: (d)CMP kinase [Microbacteriaceae bacterium]
MTKIVAIDGPAGSGKSSVSKQVARQLGFGYLDTGAAYRALAWAVANAKIETATNAAGVRVPSLEQFDYSISLQPDDFWVKVSGVDVTEAIREPEIAKSVSEVAAIPAVRSFMRTLTRELVSASNLPGVVVEGRDITTVVAPDAENRILLTASEEVRLRRRSAELTPEFAKSVEQQVSMRDAKDSKVADFMTPAAGVVLVDSSDLNFEQTVAAVLDVIRA